jgi:hypothetical protein
VERRGGGYFGERERAVKSARMRTTPAGSLLPCSAPGVLLVGGEAVERETDGGGQARVRRRQHRARARVPGENGAARGGGLCRQGGAPRHASPGQGAVQTRDAAWTRAASGSVRRRKEGDDGRGPLVSDRREVRRGWAGTGPLLVRLRQETGEVEPSWATASWAD